MDLSPVRSLTDDLRIRRGWRVQPVSVRGMSATSQTRVASTGLESINRSVLDGPGERHERRPGDGRRRVGDDQRSWTDPRPHRTKESPRRAPPISPRRVRDTWGVRRSDPRRFPLRSGQFGHSSSPVFRIFGFSHLPLWSRVPEPNAPESAIGALTDHQTCGILNNMDHVRPPAAGPGTAISGLGPNSLGAMGIGEGAAAKSGHRVPICATILGKSGPPHSRPRPEPTPDPDVPPVRSRDSRKGSKPPPPDGAVVIADDSPFRSSDSRW